MVQHQVRQAPYHIPTTIHTLKAFHSLNHTLLLRVIPTPLSPSQTLPTPTQPLTPQHNTTSTPTPPLATPSGPDHHGTPTKIQHPPNAQISHRHHPQNG